MNIGRRWLVSIGLCWLLAASVQAGEVHTSLDRHAVNLGDTVTLNIRLDGFYQVDMPDLSGLLQDFTILDSSSRSSFGMVNGHASAQVQLSFVLQPTHAGRLQIPSLNISGVPTQPQRLQVDPPVGGAAGGGMNAAPAGQMGAGNWAPPPAAAAAQRVILETSISPQTPYVGQEAVLNVKLYYAINLSKGLLDEPPSNGFKVQPLKGDANSRTTRGGRLYYVVTRHFLLTPEHAGNLTIPALTFHGLAIDPNDPNSFFGAAMRVTAKSAPLHLTVKPIPANWGSSAWLPARSLSLSLSGMPANGRAKVGQPLRLKLRLSARGLPSAALPSLNLPALNGAAVYPEPPKQSDHPDLKGTASTRERSFAIVPDHAGQLTIPEITLRWWNLASGKPELARIPAQQLQVAPAAGAPPAAASTAAPAQPSSLAALPAPSSRPPMAAGWPWPWIALGLLLLWLLSMLGAWYWLRRRRAKPMLTPPSARTEPSLGSMEPVIVAVPAARANKGLQTAFMAAAAGGEVAAQEHALLAWARSERPELKQLGELAAALASSAQRAAIARLQRARYGEGAAADNAQLAAAFAEGFGWRKDEPPAHGEDGLPPLYPFKLD